MASKTINYLKNIAESSICKTNPIIRLHYRSAFDSIATNSSESSITKSQSDLECRFCYSKSPTLKVISRRTRAKSSSKKFKKQVFMLCRVCKNKYPKDNATELISRTNEANKISLISSSLKKVENLKDFSKADVKSVEKKLKKRRQKDENAGLIIQSQVSTMNQNKAGRINENKLVNVCKGNNKLMQMLLKTSQTNGDQPSCSNKLELFLNSK